jgi:hypothetical protein
MYGEQPHLLPSQSGEHTMLNSSQVISCVNVELKANVSEISISISRVDMVNEHMSLIYIYQSVKLMPHPIGVLCRRKVESNYAVTQLT